jgi:hypothetical protein
MAKYIPQPTHPSLSPGSDPMPDFCVGKHTVGGWFRDGRWTSGSLSHILQLARGTKSVKITDWLINQNHPIKMLSRHEARHFPRKAHGTPKISAEERAMTNHKKGKGGERWQFIFNSSLWTFAAQIFRLSALAFAHLEQQSWSSSMLPALKFEMTMLFTQLLNFPTG